MAIHGFPGGVISATAPTVSPSGASGVWTLDDQLQNSANWPVTPALANNSVRLRSSASAYLNRTPAVASNRRTFTISFWAKRGESWSDNYVFEAYSDDTNRSFIRFGSDKFIFAFDGSTNNLVTTQVFRDPSSWYHFVLAVDTTQATSSNRLKLYVNGTQVTAFDTASYPAQNTQYYINSTLPHYIARSGFSGGYGYYTGYFTEWNFIDGQALTPNYFGATNPSTGAWQPATYRGTYGTNGFYLPFTNNSVYYSGLFDGTTQTAYVNYNSVLNLGTTAYTLEAFVNPTSLANSNGQQQIIGRWNSGTNERSYLLGVNNDGSVFFATSTNGNTGTGNAVSISSSAGAVTTNTWTHIRVSQTGNTVYLGINGTIVNTATDAIFGNVFSTTNSVALGVSLQGDTGTVFTGRISNVRIVKGTALSTTTYTVPTAPLTAISGTSLLTLQSSSLIDNSGNSLTITNPSGNPTISTVAPTQFGVVGLGLDYSGNNNNWTTNNISLTAGVTYDSMTDVPTNTNATTANYCVFNPLSAPSSATLTNGNLLNTTASSGNGFARGTIFVTSGKWYFEVIATQTGNGGCRIGITTSSAPNTGEVGGTSASWAYTEDGTKTTNGSSTAYGASYTDNDVIGIALDLDAGTLVFYKNNTSQGTAFTGISGEITVAVSDRSGTQGAAFNLNCGQRPFAYTPPTGFVALNTFNLPTPTIGATASTLANKYMDATTYTANGTTQTITNSGSMQPDLVWTKRRDSTSNHLLIDSVRGVGLNLSTNSTAAEVTDSVYLTSFNSNGFSIGSGNYGNGNTMVAWQWDAGTSTVTNTSGSISSQVRANTSAGFSVVTYTGTGANATVGHGLGVAPRFIIFKNRTTSPRNWIAYHASLGATVFLEPNTTAAQNSDSTQFNNTAPTSTVFSVGSSTNTNQNTNGQVAYCFSEIAGYSRFGSYTGNGSTDGTFVYTGFRPRYVLIKNASNVSSGGNWCIKDSARGTYNANEPNLIANNADQEYNERAVDFLSNGFKIRDSNGNVNLSGATIIYMAFAETPFNYANAR